MSFGLRRILELLAEFRKSLPLANKEVEAIKEELKDAVKIPFVDRRPFQKIGAGRIVGHDMGGHRTSPRVGRNKPCPCGSERKFKHCCGQSSPKKVLTDE